MFETFYLTLDIYYPRLASWNLQSLVKKLLPLATIVRLAIFWVEKDSAIKKWGHRQCWGGRFWRSPTLRGQNGGTPKKFKKIVKSFVQSRLVSGLCLDLQQISQSRWVSVSTTKKFLSLDEPQSRHPRNFPVLMSLSLDIQEISHSRWVSVSTSKKFLSLDESELAL